MDVFTRDDTFLEISEISDISDTVTQVRYITENIDCTESPSYFLRTFFEADELVIVL